MNKHFYRIVFNKARGMLMVVADIAGFNQGERRSSQNAKSRMGQISQGNDEYHLASMLSKSQRILSPLTVMTYFALGLISVAPSSYATTIVVDNNADKNQRPIINQTANGVTQVDIQGASGNGLSHNKYTQFDVSEKGVILNNSAQMSQTELAGYINGNDNLLKSGSAKIILNEINAKNASQLAGYIEVAGQKAQVIIANAAGITCNGCGFINADRATLTTGKPLIENGKLTGYQVAQGQIEINGKGLDSSLQNYTDLIARTVAINASLWGNDVSVVAGQNKVSQDLKQVDKLTESDSKENADKPQLAIDVAALGGMYAGKIQMIGTESGVGVHNAGNLGASAGSITISADGKIVNTGAIQAQQDIALTSNNTIENQKQIYAKGDLKLTSSDNIQNSGTLVAQKNINISSSNIESSKESTIAAGVDESGKLTQQGNIQTQSAKITLKGENLANKIQISASSEVLFEGAKTVADEIKIDSKKIDIKDSQIKGKDTFESHATDALNTVNSQIQSNAISLTTKNYHNEKSIVVGENTLSIDAEHIENIDNSTLYSKSDIVLDVNSLLNASNSTIASDNDLQIKANDITNHAKLNAIGSLTIDTDNLFGMNSDFISGEKLTIKAQNIQSNNSVFSAKDSIDVSANQLLTDESKYLSEQQVKLNSNQDLSINNSEIKARGDINLIGGNKIELSKTLFVGEKNLFLKSKDISAREALANIKQSIDISAENQLNINNAKFISDENVSINANQSIEQNDVVLKSKGNMLISTSQLNNNKGQLIANENLKIDVKNKLNANNAIFYADNDLSISAQDIQNNNSKLYSGHDLGVNAKNVSVQNSEIQSGSDLSINAEELLDSKKSVMLAGEALKLKAKNIDSDYSSLKANGVFIQADSQLKNNNGYIYSHSLLDLSAGFIDGQNSSYLAAQSININALQNLNLNKSHFITEKDLSISGNEIIAQDGIFESLGNITFTGFDLLNALNSEITANNSIFFIGKDVYAQNTLFSTKNNLILNTQTVDYSNSTWAAGGELLVKADIAKGFKSVLNAESIELTLDTRLEQEQSTLVADSININSQLVNSDQSTLFAENDIQINADSLSTKSSNLIAKKGQVIAKSIDMDNQDAKIQAGKNISLKANNEMNNIGSVFISGNDFILQATKLNNQLAKFSSGHDLSLSGSFINNEQSLLLAKNDLVLSALNDLNNKNSVIQIDGKVSLDGKNINNQDAKIIAQNDIKLKANKVDNQKAQIKSDKNLLIESGDVFNQDATLIAQDITLTSTDSIDNSRSTLYGYKNVSLSGNIIDNQDSTILSDGKLHINAAQIISNENANIQAKSDIDMSSQGELNNKNADIVALGDIGFNALTMNNEFAELQSKGNMQLHSDQINNESAALLSEKNISLIGNNQNGSINNKFSKLTAGNLITLDSKDIDGQHSKLSSNGNILVNAMQYLGQNSTIIANNDLNFNVNQLNTQNNQITSNDLSVMAENWLNQYSSLKVIGNLNANVNERIVNDNTSYLAGNMQFTADNFVGKHNLKSAGDLSLTVNSSYINDDKVLANGSIIITSSGDIINNGQFISGDKIILKSERLDNHQDSEISSDIINIDNKVFNNTGIVDSNELYLSSSQQLNNIKTGKIYGENILINSAELNNIGQDEIAPIIAARNALSIGAKTINNEYSAQLLSLGQLTIGGEIINGSVVGHADKLTNKSATIESQGNLLINAQIIDNLNTHIVTEEQLSDETPERVIYFHPKDIPDAKYSIDELTFQVNRNGSFVFLPWDELTEQEKNNSEIRRIYVISLNDDFRWFYHYDYTVKKYITVLTESAPALITSAGNISINSDILTNDNSKIVAGNELFINTNTLNNLSAPSTVRSVYDGRVYFHKHNTNGSFSKYESTYDRADEIVHNDISSQNIQDHQTVSVNDFKSGEHNNETVVINKDEVSSPEINPNNSANSAVEIDDSNKQINDVGISKPTTNGDIDYDVVVDDSKMGAISDITTPDTSDLSSMVVGDNNSPPVSISTIEPNVTLPNSSLYTVNKNKDNNYLIETDPRFTNKQNWLNSDYMLKQLKLDPNNLQKRLGDGYYEQQLIREQILSLTGNRYLGNYSDDMEQYKALMNNGVTFAQQYGLSIGVGLSPELMQNLTSDIVWLVEKTVNLNGEAIRVLAPQVYVVNRPQLSTDGALLSGKTVSINGQQVNNKGMVIAEKGIGISVDNIDNEGSLYGDEITIKANKNINSSGNIIADKQISLTAEEDINLISTLSTQTAGNDNITTNIDRISSLQVNNGDIKLNALNDINLSGALITNLGKDGVTSLDAENNINLSSIDTEDKFSFTFSNTHYRKNDDTYANGTEIISEGDIQLSAGNNITANAASISTNKSLGLKADGDITIGSSEETTEVDYYLKQTKKSMLGSKTQINIYQQDDVTKKGSMLSGNTVDIDAGKNLSIEGSQVLSDSDMFLSAKENVNINASEESYYTNQQTIKKKSGLLSGGGLGFTIGKEKESLKQTDTNQAYAVSTIGSTNGSVNITAGQNLDVQGSDVIAKADINLQGENVNITANDSKVTYKEEYKYEKTGLTVALTGTAADVYDAKKAVDNAKKKDNDTLLALQSIKSGLAGANAGLDIYGAATGSSSSEASIGVSASFGSQKTEREVNQEQHNVVGSGISAEKNITITATGNDKKDGGDINVVGSEVRAGQDVTLNANNDVNVIGAVNTQHTDSDEKSSGSSVGVGVVLGADGKFGWQLTGNSNFSRERENADGSAWSEGIVSAGNNLNVNTGNNVNVVGGQLEGDTVKVNVGNDLNIQSLQDSDNYDYEKLSTSVGGSITLGPGSGGSANFSTSKTEMESNWASVTDQSGIYAGNGGFDITVGNNTDLKGAVIASTAEDKSKNKLDTGTISFEDIQNKADFNVDHVSIDVSVGSALGYTPTPGAPSIYHNDGSASSTTKSAVEDGTLIVRNSDKQTQDTNDLSRDTENANNALGQIFDKQKEQDRMDAIDLVKDIAAQAKDVAQKYSKIKAEERYNALSDDEKTKLKDEAKAQLEKQGKNPSDGDILNQVISQLTQNKGIGNMGDSFSKGLDAASSIITGIITGDLTGGLAGASAPYLAEQIKLATGHQDPITGEWKTDDKEANLIAHAILGGAVAAAQGNSALAGSTGALTGEAAAGYIKDLLYGKETNIADLTQEQKENISNLAQIASGLAVAAEGGNVSDVGTSVASSKNAVENNGLATLPLKACAIAAPCRGFVAKKILEYGIKAGITAIVAKEIADNISSEDLDHLITLNLTGNDEVTNRYLGYLADKYATTIAIDPNDERFKPAEGYPIPEEPKPIIISTPIPEQDKDAGKLVTPIVEQDKNEGVYAGPEINVGDWRDNVLTADNRLPIPEKTTANNGLDIESNTKHTPGAPGFRPDAGIEPKDSLDLFEKSVPTADPKVRLAIDDEGNIHRFSNSSKDGSGTYHWSGSTGDKNPLGHNELRKFNDIIKELKAK